jgi:hypothetical protein
MSVSPGKWVWDRIYKKGNYEKESLDFLSLLNHGTHSTSDLMVRFPVAGLIIKNRWGKINTHGVLDHP